MKKKTLLKLYQRFGKELLGINVKVKLDEEYYFEHMSEIVGVMANIPNDEIEIYLTKYFNSIGVNLSPYTIYYLHELGHLNHKLTHNLNKKYYDSQLLEVELLNVITEQMSIPFDKSLEIYYQIESEKIANEYIKYAMTEKKEIVEKFNTVLEKLYA